MSFNNRYQNLNPYDLHKKLINEYLMFKKDRSSLFRRDTSRDKKDIDIIKENHRFLWEEGKDDKNLSWEKRLAKKYYDKLYKEYCVGDLSRYKENKIGLRWRTEQELINGKGQFSCGSRKCTESENLRTWEVNFGYVEEGEKKNALVKLRLCPECSYKLNYHHKKKEVKRLKKSKQKLKDEPSCSEPVRKRRKEDEEVEDITEKKTEEEREEEKSESNKEENESDIWKSNNVPEDEEEGKSREEEFDEYLDQLFL